mgnify:FL=1
MDLIQTAGFTLLCFILWSLLYTYCAPSAGRLRIYAKLFLVANALLLFISLNLYFSAKNAIAVKQLIEKYSVGSTVDLLKIMHEEGHTVEMQENRLFIDRGTDHERIFVLMREPFFYIIDQAKMVQMTKELPN